MEDIMVNIGIIGAGRIGQVHARSIISGVQGARVAKVADPYIKPEVKEWMEEENFEGIYIAEDYGGHQRVVLGRKGGEK